MPKGQTILVVDDNEAMTSVLGEMLHAHGYRVLTAHNGVDGRDSYAQHPVDIVITDIQMPIMDGLEMMRCIRSLNPSVKTIYVSGSTGHFRKHLELEQSRFGASVLRKPFSTKALLQLVSSIPAAQEVRSKRGYLST